MSNKNPFLLIRVYNEARAREALITSVAGDVMSGWRPFGNVIVDDA